MFLRLPACGAEINCRAQMFLRSLACGVEISGQAQMSLRLYLYDRAFSYIGGYLMIKEGQFYFLSDQFYITFPDNKLMKNKEVIDGEKHDRPCFFAFSDNKNPDILWCIPISSKIEKYEAIYKRKMEKYHKCNTIRFGNVMGIKKAFLIQNMFPITKKYIANVYIDKNTKKPVTIDPDTARDIITNAKDVLKLHRRGIPLIFPNVTLIEKVLLSQLQIENIKLSINSGKALNESTLTTESEVAATVEKSSIKSKLSEIRQSKQNKIQNKIHRNSVERDIT